jgi:hypothetical protein
MKRVLLIALAAALTVGAAGNAAAQKFELGARVGVGSQNMDVEALGLFTDGKARLGWNIAAVSRIRLIGFGDGILGAGLFFQPEVVYSQSSIKGNEFMFYHDSPPAGTVGDPTKLKTKTVDVPLLLSLKVSVARIQAGPVFNLMSDFSKGDLELLPVRAPVGYAVGASVDLLGLTFDGRYHGDFSKLKYKESGLEDIKSRFSSWSLGVGIMF